VHHRDRVSAFRENDKLIHRFNPDLGPGRVEKVDGRRIVVFFPAVETRLTLAADDKALRPLPIGAGQKARLEGEEGDVVVDAIGAFGVRLADGRTVDPALLWPLAPPRSGTGSTAFASPRSARPPGWARSSAGASRSTRTSSTSPSAPRRPIQCAGCSPTRWASARRSRPA